MRYGMVWYGRVWYGRVWYGRVWYGMVWYGMVWYGMVGCPMRIWSVLIFHSVQSTSLKTAQVLKCMLCMLDSTRIFTQHPRGWRDAKHISKGDFWRHFEKAERQ